MNETARLLLVQNPTTSKNRFYFPSNFPWSRRCCGLQLCTLKEFEKTFFKSFSCYLTVINCKGQQIPKPLIWWGKEETPSESSGTTSGLNFALKMSGSFCVQEESLLKHSWYLQKVGLHLELCSWNNIMSKVSPKPQEVNGYDSWHHISLGLQHHLQVKKLH